MSTGPPSGIVSFLFTDVEGSTTLWEAEPGAMSASLAVHDEILRESIAGHRGHVFSTSGDAFAAAFHTSTDALGAAVDAQLALAGTDWPGPPLSVRMGIHTGEAEERNGDYFGPVLNRAARIMAASHGGQILLSGAAAEMSATWIADGTSLIDLGPHRLKDLEVPEHVFRVDHPLLPVVDGPIRTGRRQTHNLTEYLTTFVGRNAELETISSLVEDHRLLTLTGVGGTGKTRLAVEAARRLLPDILDGCWLVELAPVTNPDVLMLTVGEVFDVRPGPGATVEKVIGQHLRDLDVLVIIDNCEHLLDAASSAIRTLLAAGPGVKVIATSRESLGISGESIVRVPSLGLPADADHVEDADAVHLFLDRAREMRPDLAPTHADLAAIARICVRIDGIPLGLELAAARLRSLSPGDLADRLDESFRVLSGSAKTALPRQRTLNATIDWSHTLLSPAERAVFRRMAMFLNGFDLAAAEAVCSSDDVDESEVLDRLDSLVDKSLLVASHDPVVGTRYRMLEPVRQYAQEQLSTSGEATDVRMAHARHFARYVSMASPLMRRAGQMTWERRLDEDYDNVRAAFTTLLEADEIDAYLDLAFDLFSYWQHVGFHFEGIPTIEAGLNAAPETTDPVRLIKAYFTMAALGFETTLPRSVDDSAKGLEIATATGDLNLIGRMELAHGAAIRHATMRPDFGEHVIRGRELLTEHPEPSWWEEEWEHAFHDFLFSGYLPPGTDGIRAHSERAIKTFEGLGDDAQLVAALCESAMQTGGEDDDWVTENLERAIDMIQYVHVPYWAGHAYMFMGLLHYQHGDHPAAEGFLAEGLRPLEDSGDISCWSVSMRAMAGAASSQGRHSEALRQMGSILERADVLPLKAGIPRLLSTAAVVLAGASRPEQAAMILGHLEASGAELPPYVPQFNDVSRSNLVEQLGDGTEDLLAQGAAQDEHQLLEELRRWLAQ